MVSVHLTYAAWHDFLGRLSVEQGVAPEHIDRLLSFWDKLNKHFGKELLPPLTAVTADGAIQLSWDSGKQYFDIELLPDGCVLWFFRDRDTREIAGTDDETPLFRVLTAEGFTYLSKLVG